MCGEWEAAYSLYIGLTFSLGVLLVIGSLTLRESFVRTKKILERRFLSSKTESAASVAIRSFYAESFCLVVLPLFASVLVPEADGYKKFFSSDWYRGVGPILLILAVSLALVHPLIQLCVGLSKRSPIMQLERQYGSFFMIMFLAMTFGAGMPLLFLFAGLAMLAYFWIDKALCCSRRALPPQYGIKMAHLTANVLTAFAICHLLFGFSMHIADTALRRCLDGRAYEEIFWNNSGLGGTHV